MQTRDMYDKCSRQQICKHVWYMYDKCRRKCARLDGYAHGVGGWYQSQTYSILLVNVSLLLVNTYNFRSGPERLNAEVRSECATKPRALYINHIYLCIVYTVHECFFFGNSHISRSGPQRLNAEVRSECATKSRGVQGEGATVVHRERAHAPQSSWYCVAACCSVVQRGAAGCSIEV